MVMIMIMTTRMITAITMAPRMAITSTTTRPT
jgi:hypothetical protein